MNGLVDGEQVHLITVLNAEVKESVQVLLDKIKNSDINNLVDSAIFLRF